MNSNKCFEKIINIAMLGNYCVQNISFPDVEKLPTSDLIITMRTGNNLLSNFTFNYHGKLRNCEINTKVIASHLKTISRFLDEVQKMVQENE
jgi:hypothetical protein